MLRPKPIFSKVRLSGLLATALGGFGLKIGAAGIGFINGVIIARLLGPRELGVYTLLMATATLVATIATMGLPSLIVQRLATYVVHEQWGLLKGLLNNSRMWILLSSLLAIATLATLHRLGVLDSRLHPIALVGMLTLLPLLALTSMRSAILRGFHRVILADVPELILRPLLILIMLGSCLLWMPQIDSNHMLIIQIVAVVAAFIVGLGFVHAHTPIEVHRAHPETTGARWLITALPFFAVTVTGTFENQIAFYILSYRTNATQVGLFQVANQLVGLVVMGITAVNISLQPRIAAAWAQGDKIAIQKLASHTVLISTAIALAACAILMTLTEPLLMLYGRTYQDAALTLRILTIGQLLNAAAGPSNIILGMTGNQSIVLVGQCLALLVNITAAWLLSPHWGSMGAAIAAILGLLTWNTLLAFSVYRKIHINTTIIPFKIKKPVTKNR